MKHWPVLCLLTALFLALSTVAGAASKKPINVFVSVLPLKYFVERIGGEHVDVSVMVPPGRSPATYDPAPRQMATLSNASIYYRIGVPFERSWIKRIADLNPEMRIVNLQEGMNLRTLDNHRHEKSNQAIEEKDPHLWTDPGQVKIMAGKILDTLSEMNPAARDEFAENYRVFLLDLDQLDRFIKERLKDVKQRTFLVFHPSWGYFAEAYDLQQLTIESQGKEPGPRALAQTIEMAKKENIRIIFVQQQFSKKTAETVARAIGGTVVTVDPLAEDYIANMRSTAENFARALKE